MAARRAQKGEGGGRRRVQLLVQREEPDHAVGPARRDQRLLHAPMERRGGRLPVRALDGVPEDRGEVRVRQRHAGPGRLPRAHDEVRAGVGIRRREAVHREGGGQLPGGGPVPAGTLLPPLRRVRLPLGHDGRARGRVLHVRVARRGGAERAVSAGPLVRGLQL